MCSLGRIFSFKVMLGAKDSACALRSLVSQKVRPFYSHWLLFDYIQPPNWPLKCNLEEPQEGLKWGTDSWKVRPIHFILVSNSSGLKRRQSAHASLNRMK